MNTYIYTYKYVYPHIHIHMYTIAVSKPLSLFHAQDSTIHNATHTQTHPLYLSYTHTHNFFWRAGCVTCAHTHCLPPYMLPPHDSAIYMRTSHDARFDESRRTSEWVMLHIWMSHVAHLNESCRSSECMMPHIKTNIAYLNDSCRTSEWATSHIWMSHIAYLNESCRTSERVTSHIWTSHAAPENEHRTFEWVKCLFYTFECAKTCIAYVHRHMYTHTCTHIYTHMHTPTHTHAHTRTLHTYTQRALHFWLRQNESKINNAIFACVREREQEWVRKHTLCCA